MGILGLALLMMAAQARGPQAAKPAALYSENLAGLAAGAVVVVRPTVADANGEAWFLLDEDLRTGWTSLEGRHLDPTVIELADRSLIHQLQFDTGGVAWDGRLPKRVLVEMSDTSATDGFKPIADVTLAAALKDGQLFKTSADVPGRWLRLSVKSMQDPEKTLVQIMDFRAFGERLTRNPPVAVTGTYQAADGSILHFKQDGTRVTGCNESGAWPLEGGVDGRVLTFGWRSENDEGPAVAVFGTGAQFWGFWKKNGAEPDTTINVVEVKKRSAQPGDCPNWHTADPLADELKKAASASTASTSTPIRTCFVRTRRARSTWWRRR